MQSHHPYPYKISFLLGRCADRLGGMAGDVFARLHAELLLEALAEIRRIVESHHVAYLVDTVLVFQQQRGRFLQPDDLNHFVRCGIGQPFELSLIHISEPTRH